MKVFGLKVRIMRAQDSRHGWKLRFGLGGSAQRQPALITTVIVPAGFPDLPDAIAVGAGMAAKNFEAMGHYNTKK